MAGKGDKWRKGTIYAKYREGWDLIKRKKKKEQRSAFPRGQAMLKASREKD